MRRVPLATLLVPVLVAVPGCVPDEPKPAEAPPAPAAPPVVVAPPSREQLSADARWVLSVVGCGSEIGQPEFRQAVVRVWNAGPEIVPVLAELVPRGDFALVCNAARIGTDHPPSVELRAALRARRDAIGLEQAPYSWVGYLLVYFARFGDETDLAWMEKAVGGLREKDRPRGEEHLRQLRARLAPN